MDLSIVLPPSTRTSFIPALSQGGCAKLLYSCSRRAAEQYVNSLSNHTRWLRHSNSFTSQPSKPLSLSMLVYAATLEGDMVADNCSTETVLKSEIGEAFQTAGNESANIEPSVEASKTSHAPGVDRRYAPAVGRRYSSRVGKDILVPLDALKPGAILTGKVTNIEKFGVFVDIGAFSSGLIHISNLTNTFVSSIEDIVKKGDEVKVKVLSVYVHSGRISLKLIREDGEPKVEKPLPSSEQHVKTLEKPLPSSEQHVKTPKSIFKKSPSNRAGRPQKGELITGSIAKIVSSGVFVTLKQGHEGYLPASEVLSSGQSVETSSFFRIGQQIPVRVLRTTKDRITLTMKKQEHTVDSTEAVASFGEGRATSPFEIAFRRDKVMAKFLEDRENLSKDIVEDGSVNESPTEIHQS